MNKIFYLVCLVFLTPCCYAVSVDYPTEVKELKNKELKYFGFSVTLNYFKSISDSTALFLKTDSAEDPFSGTFVYPKWDHDIGYNIGVKLPIKSIDWQTEINWTHVKNTSKVTREDVGDFQILAIPHSPSINFNQGHFSKHGKAKVSVVLDLINWQFKSPFFLKKSLEVVPVIGIQNFFIRQQVDAAYEDISPAGPFSLASKTIYKNINWGVGPLIGASVNLVLPYGVTFDFSSEFSAMIGGSKTQTVFEDLNESIDKYRSNIVKIFPHRKIRASVKKEWGCNVLFGLVFGWEINVFSNQLSEKQYGNATSGKTSSDITMQGPFVNSYLEY